MADVKTEYGTEAQAITVTLASLADQAARESAAVDNRTNKWLDALVSVVIKLQAGTPASDKAVYVFLAATVDIATPTWPDVVTGADAAITPNSPTQLRLLGTIFAPTSAGTFKGGPWSVASRLDGAMPEEWSIIVQNKTGIAFDASEGTHKKVYQGLFARSL